MWRKLKCATRSIDHSAVVQCKIHYADCSAISGHMVVCHAALETWGVQQTGVYFTGVVKKTTFSHICSLTLPEHNQTKFYEQASLRWGTSISKFELNLPSFSRDMCLQSLSYFLLFAILFEITNLHILWWIALRIRIQLEHIRAYLLSQFEQ